MATLCSRSMRCGVPKVCVHIKNACVVLNRFNPINNVVNKWLLSHVPTVLCLFTCWPRGFDSSTLKHSTYVLFVFVSPSPFFAWRERVIIFCCAIRRTRVVHVYNHDRWTFCIYARLFMVSGYFTTRSEINRQCAVTGTWAPHSRNVTRGGTYICE